MFCYPGGGVTKLLAQFVVPGRILIPAPPDAAGRKGTQRLRCSMGRCSRRGSLKAAFRWWYQDAPVVPTGLGFDLTPQLGIRKLCILVDYCWPSSAPKS